LEAAFKLVVLLANSTFGDLVYGQQAVTIEKPYFQIYSFELSAYFGIANVSLPTNWQQSVIVVKSNSSIGSINMSVIELKTQIFEISQISNTMLFVFGDSSYCSSGSECILSTKLALITKTKFYNNTNPTTHLTQCAIGVSSSKSYACQFGNVTAR